MIQIGTRPIRLVCNRIFRDYPGGREIDLFRGAATAQDDLSPEAWVGSDTLTCDAGESGDATRGLAECYTQDGGRAWLRDLLRQSPVQLMGGRHVEAFGDSLGILVKLLDAKDQLGLQCHPDRQAAMRYFGSPYGKLECWYILSTRTDGEEPYLLLGFKEGISEEKFRAGFLKGDVPYMESLCHKVVPKPGEMYFVDAGLPHAIGPGCFVVEVQEPSDITLGCVLWQTGDPVYRQSIAERTIGSYHYEGSSFRDNLAKYRVPPRVLKEGEGGTEALLLGLPHTHYFSVTRINVSTRMPAGVPGEYAIAIVTGGSGRLAWAQGETPAKRGDEFFLPAGLRDARWEGEMEIISSYPPGVHG